eukprot:PhF_6_TR37596/c1_g1_i1/m.55818
MELKNALVKRRSESHGGGGVFWMFVCCKCCGFSEEVSNYVIPLREYRYVVTNAQRECYFPGSPSDSAALDEMDISKANPIPPTSSFDFVVFHSQPSFYEEFERTLLKWDIQTKSHQQRVLRIARTMSEYVPIDPEEVKILNNDSVVDFVLVPAKFWQNVYEQSGVRASKIYVLPESLNTRMYTPVPWDMKPDLKQLITPWRHQVGRGQSLNDVVPPSDRRNEWTVFLSIFKWEMRKGWRYLLEAYFTLQMDLLKSKNRRVLLIIHTVLPASEYSVSNSVDRHDPARFVSTIEVVAAQLNPLPFLVITEVLSQQDLIRLYQSADVFVLPSCGEGWGLPVMEAMALGIPTITTRWSGMTAFTTPETAFLVDVLSELKDVLDQSKPYKPQMAVPDVIQLRQYMEFVINEPGEAREVGRRGGEHIRKNFDRMVIGKQLDDLLNQLKNKP